MYYQHFHFDIQDQKSLNRYEKRDISRNFQVRISYAGKKAHIICTDHY